MTAQHTPGSWRQEDIEQDGNILITDEQGVTIATCWKQPLDPPEWVQGNADLIEAAPDLVALAKRYRHLLSELHAGNSFSKEHLWQSLVEADVTLLKAGAA